MRLAVVATLLLACKRETIALAPEAGVPEAGVTSAVEPTPDHGPTGPLFDEPYYIPTDPPLQFDEQLPGDDPIHRVTRGKCWPEQCSKDVEVTLLVHVSPAGTVDKITIEKGDPKVGACLAEAARKARFGPSDAGGTYAVPFIYRCDGGSGYSHDHGTKQEL